MQAWRRAAILGLVSSIYSTAISQLAATRLGRDAAVDWMTVATIPFRDGMLGVEPTWSAIMAGIAFHQWADFSWALVFFGLFAAVTARLSAQAIAGFALIWAVFTSASEWFLLVPLFPFYQPLFTLQQPYWIGLLVHIGSALVYPMYGWLRPQRAERNERVFLIGWTALLMVLLAGVSVLDYAGQAGRTGDWIGGSVEADQTYMRHMTTHHDQGIELATLAAQRARDPHLRALARLMVASQSGENRILKSWWRSWFDEPMQICSPGELAAMPGFLGKSEVARLRDASADRFDAVFVDLMSRHHAGAVAMADAMWNSAGDPRLRVMAHAIRHAQQGEIALMHGVHGTAAVSAAVANMFSDNVNPGRDPSARGRD